MDDVNNERSTNQSTHLKQIISAEMARPWLSPAERELWWAIRFLAAGQVESLYDVAVRIVGQEYHYAHDNLRALERMGLVTVARRGPGCALEIHIPQEILMSTLFIALDPGFGNTKICIDGRVSCQQSAVARPVEIGQAASGMRVAADSGQRVAFDDFEFIVGAGSWRWGHAIGSMDYAGIVGPERLALMYAGIAAVTAQVYVDAGRPMAEDLGDVYLIVGLPVPLMQDNAQMALIIDSLRKLKREHRFICDGAQIRFDVVGIKSIAQPVGAYMDWLYTDELNMREGAERADVAIVDLGMNTLDLFVLERGQVRPGYLGGDKVGVRRLLGLLSNNGYELTELDSMLRNGRLQAREGELDIWLGEVLAIIERTWPSLRRFTVVIPTGGGAALLDERLTTALAAKGAAIYWSADPVTANVKGLWKYGAKHVAR
jgi:predicted transcriptional regulator